MALQLMVSGKSDVGQEQFHQLLAKSSADRVLSENESFQLVKIFLNSSIACICYVREILSWTSDSLKTRYIEQVDLDNDGDEIYDSFLSTRVTKSPSTQQVRVLVRSQSQRANTILDLLEYGVFDAIRCAWLDTLQVFLVQGPIGEQSIVEAYTFVFEYERNQVVNVRLDQVDQPFTLLRSQKSFKAAIRGLLRAMQELPRLPGKCSLGMSLSYTSQCPKIYEPIGFTDALTHNIKESHWKSLWQKPSAAAACFESTYHNISISTRRPEAFTPTPSQVQDTIMSKQLQEMQKTSSSRNHALNSTFPPSRPIHIKEADENNLESKQRGSRLEMTPREGSAPDVQHPSSLQSIPLNGMSSPQPQSGNSVKNPAALTTPDKKRKVCGSEDSQNSSPRKRRKSISKLFINVGSSTPASRGHTGQVDETASEDECDLS